MDTFLYTIDDEFLDLYEPIEYSDDLCSPSSIESDVENQPYQNLPKRCGKSPVKKVQQRTAANMRERRRMKSINDAFDSLRTCIPTAAGADRRLSKVDTLKLAISYISYLADLVENAEYNTDSQFPRCNRPQEKVIVRCHFADTDSDDTENIPLVGHSLSWFSDKDPKLTADNKLSARVWVPDNATDADLINLTTYAANDYGHCA